MVSDTKITERRRRAKRSSVGRDQKRERTKAGTPKFPIHPEGLPKPAPKALAAAAKPAAKPAAAAPKKA